MIQKSPIVVVDVLSCILFTFYPSCIGNNFFFFFLNDTMLADITGCVQHGYEFDTSILIN